MGNPRKPLGLPSSFRLKNASSIRRIAAEGGRLLRPGFSAHWQTWPDTEEQEGTQVAFVVSRHSGDACTRNRIKRRLREAVRLNRGHWPPRTRIVIKARGAMLAKASFDSLLSEMKQTLLRIGETAPK